MDNFNKNREEEINKAILEWIIKKNYSNSIEPFLNDTGLKAENSAKDNMLERKWGTIILLQKKVLDLENQLKNLSDELSLKSSSSYSTKKDLESFGLPKTPAKATLKGHRGSITALIFHPNYNILVSGSEDASIITWECDEFTKEKQIKGHTAAINSLTFETTGKLLASCSSDLTIKIWNFESLSCLKTLSGHEHSISSIEFTPNGDFLISASRDKSIKIWEVNTGFIKKTFNGHSEWVRSISINASGNLLASASDDESIIIWNIETGNECYFLSGHENKIEIIQFVRNEKAITNIFHSDFVHKFNKGLMSNLEEDKVKEGDGQSQESYKNKDLTDLNRQLMEKAKVEEKVSQVKINKEYLISGSRDKTIKIWDIYSSSCICSLFGHDNWIRTLFVSPNGNYIISASDDKSIRIWELKTGRCTKKILDAHERFVVSLAINSKYPLMASGSNDQSIKVWDCK